MKKLLLLLVAAGGALSTFAQAPVVKNYATDADLSRWVIDLNLLGGLAGQDLTTVNSFPNYLNAVNSNTGQLKFKNGYSFGGDAELGFFFGKKRHFGFGAGIMYMQQHGDAVLENYHVEYQATDGTGNVYRQLVTGNNVKEEVVSSMFNIPIVLKYKNRFSKHWGFTADAGALVNFQMRNAYTTHASFDNEAYYKFIPNDAGGTTSVYDNSAIPDVNDWKITKAEFLKNNPNGNVNDYFNAKRALGYNVGTGLHPTTTTGKTSYNRGSIGFIIQPSFNYFLSDNVALNFGVYYMYQPFQNDAQYGYRLTDGNGGYSSVLNNTKTIVNEAYGINIGARFFLGKKRTPISITSTEQVAPTQCGLCDGSIALHGLPPNQPVVVDYSLNGAQPNNYTTTVGPDGQVKIANLCAGNYTGIVARIDKKNANGTPVTLSDPQMTITAINSTNPSAVGTCDGTITMRGLYAGQNVTVNYSVNGAAPVVYTAVVNSDNTVTITGLCEGTYNGFTATTLKNCKATWTGSNTVLTAPVPPPPPPAPVTVIEETDLSTPILFDFNKSTIHVSSYPILNEATKELKEDKNLYIRVDAYTDIIGTAAYNQKLSERRANSVKTYLKKNGANPGRIRVVGHGKSDPVGDNNTDEGRAKNRRAVMHKVSK